MKRLCLFLVIVLLLFIMCSTPQEAADPEPVDGTITLTISKQHKARNRMAYVKLFSADVNVYDPNVLPLVDTTFVVDLQGQASITFPDTMPAGKTYQIAGVIDAAGTVFRYPENGDYTFKVDTAPVDGDMTIALADDDLKAYSMITGESFISRGTGHHSVTIWESSEREGTCSLGWIGDVDNILFRFNGKNGAIGRVGTSYVNKRVNDVNDDFIADVDAEIAFTGDGKYYFCIYGWVISNTNWNDSDIKHEFYVIEDYNRQETDPLIGSITVDGIEYDMHRFDFGGGSYRFKAVRKTDVRTTGPVSMKPFFDYWRQNGMQNFYVHDLNWAIELLYGNHDGTFYCWNIDIPSFQ